MAPSGTNSTLTFCYYHGHDFSYVNMVGTFQLLQERVYSKNGSLDEAVVAGDKARSLEKAHFE